MSQSQSITKQQHILEEEVEALATQKKMAQKHRVMCHHTRLKWQLDLKYAAAEISI
jgi:hypothetical protein